MNLITHHIIITIPTFAEISKQATMPISEKLADRNQALCELCNSKSASNEYLVSPKNEHVPENLVALCDDCYSKLDKIQDDDYWRCLEGSIWNPEASVQALSYRILYLHKNKEWADSIIHSVELSESTINWAMSIFEVEEGHIDAYGNKLENGDNVILTQALNVKGTNFSAAKGTVVKRIKLVPGNTGQIEGKINDQTIVILTKYVKKG